MSGHSKSSTTGWTALETVIRKVNHSLAILIEPRGRRKDQRGRKPMILANKKTRKTTNTCRQDIWPKILQEAAIWYNPNLVMETWGVCPVPGLHQ